MLSSHCYCLYSTVQNVPENGLAYHPFKKRGDGYLGRGASCRGLTVRVKFCIKRLAFITVTGFIISLEIVVANALNKLIEFPLKLQGSHASNKIRRDWVVGIGISGSRRGYGKQCAQRFVGLRAERRCDLAGAIDTHGQQPDFVTIELLRVAVWTEYIARLHDRVGMSDGSRDLQIRGQSDLVLTDRWRLLGKGIPPALRHVARHCDESTWHGRDSTSYKSGWLARDLVSVGCGFVCNIQIQQHPIDVPQSHPPENFASRFWTVQVWPDEGLVGRMLNQVQGGFSTSGPGAA
eukprot:scaffold122320_cov63-Attheya_sp.AAC.2